MTEKQMKIFNEGKRYLFMVLGCICYSLSLSLFLIPNEIVGGGISGKRAGYQRVRHRLRGERSLRQRLSPNIT